MTTSPRTRRSGGASMPEVGWSCRSIMEVTKGWGRRVSSSAVSVGRPDQGLAAYARRTDRPGDVAVATQPSHATCALSAIVCTFVAVCYNVGQRCVYAPSLWFSVLSLWSRVLVIDLRGIASLAQLACRSVQARAGDVSLIGRRDGASMWREQHAGDARRAIAAAPPHDHPRFRRLVGVDEQRRCAGGGALLRFRRQALREPPGAKSAEAVGRHWLRHGRYHRRRGAGWVRRMTDGGRMVPVAGTRAAAERSQVVVFCVLQLVNYA